LLKITLYSTVSSIHRSHVYFRSKQTRVPYIVGNKIKGNVGFEVGHSDLWRNSANPTFNDIACYCGDGFGAWAVSRKTYIYFMMLKILLKVWDVFVMKCLHQV